MNRTAPLAIVDIGSNSVRLVVYSGASRAPFVLFNEKVMAGLGRNLDATGRLSRESQARALSALARYKLLAGRMGAERIRVFATAAVREAANAADFIGAVEQLGLTTMVLSGEEEGRLAALGVISGIPDADGVIGDLGGGSLELADIAGGEVRRRISLPLGVLRIAAMEARSTTERLRRICRVLQRAGFREGEGRAFYMIGGSWRALARLDLELTGHPLPVTHQHELSPDRPRQLQRRLRGLAVRGSPIARIAGGRAPTLAHANLLLRAVVDTLKPSRLVASAYGIREGLLYDDLDEATRRLDPLIEAARDVGGGLGRFPQHGDLIDAWIAPIFDDAPAAARIRLAACLLSDIAWAAHPDFRAERGVDMALHGNWVAIDAAGRAVLAQALFTTFGGGSDLPYPRIAALVPEPMLRRARQWGLAIRLAQRLSAGVAEPLARSSLVVEGDRLVLWLPEEESAMFGESVERRLKTLAGALEKRPDFLFG
jgi:exopolyphosphatase / guanosine-5'-triphosphate,3'-diphosphate pyrophosphatase